MLPSNNVLEPPKIAPISLIIKQTEQPKSNPDYIIKEGDTLTSISEALHVPLTRLWAANPQLANPDVLAVADPLKIPLNTDVLPERGMISTVPVGTVRTQGTAVTGGSNFSWGWCTFFADQQRPDIHATGNAADWIRYANSKVPVKGAVAVNTFAAGGLGHVGIVLDFTDKKVLVRSMNFKGFGVVTDDWLDLSYFSGYII